MVGSILFYECTTAFYNEAIQVPINRWVGKKAVTFIFGSTDSTFLLWVARLAGVDSQQNRGFNWFDTIQQTLNQLLLCVQSTQKCQHKQINKQMLERLRRKGNPSALLVRMQTGAATVENSMEFPQKTKNRTTLWPSNSAAGIMLCVVF